MADQQLVDYIKKVKEIGQTDEQIRNSLYQNGWTEAEVDDAFSVASPQPSQAASQPKAEPEPQVATQSKPQSETQFRQQPQPEPEPKYQPQSTQQLDVGNELRQLSNTPKTKSSHMILKLLIVLIILIVIGGVGYFAIAQEGLLKSFFNTAPVQTKNNENVSSSASSISVSSATSVASAPAPSSAPAPAPAWCYTFTKNLGWADSGTDVIAQLHTALEKEGFSYAPDTGNIYNTGTSQAMIQFQTKYGISPASGFVGTKTREELNKLYGCAPVNSTSTPAP